MGTCVECARPVPSLYTYSYKQYEQTIRLTPCPSCNAIAADPYVEFEQIIVILDLILHKKQAYRHVLFNRKLDTVCYFFCD